MIHLNTFFLFFFLSFFSLASLPEKAWMSPKAHQSLLLDLHVINQQRIIAVGERGHILLSKNGQDWQQISSPVDVTLTDVFFVDEQHGWIVGHDATILHSQNGGVSWHIQQYLPVLEKPLFNIVFKNSKEGIAVGAYGLFYRTKDGGKDWQLEFHEEFLMAEDVDYLASLKVEDEEAYLDERSSILPHFNHLEIDGHTLYLVGEMGTIAKSNDFGQYWQIIPAFYHGSLFSLMKTKQGRILAVGLRGHVFKLDNNGKRWEQVNASTQVLLNAIFTDAENQYIYLVGNDGTLLQSIDNGENFSALNHRLASDITYGVWFNQQLIIVSDNGVYALKQNNTTQYFDDVAGHIINPPHKEKP